MYDAIGLLLDLNFVVYEGHLNSYTFYFNFHEVSDLSKVSVVSHSEENSYSESPHLIRVIIPKKCCED